MTHRELSDGSIGDSTNSGTLSAMGAASAVLKRLRLVVVAALVMAAVFAAIAVLGGGRFTSMSIFLPERASGGSLGQYSGLAARFGFSVGSGQAGESLAFYAELLKSPTLLDELARSRFTPPSGGASGSRALFEILEAEGETDADRIDNAKAMLEEIVVVDTDIEAGTVIVRTSAATSWLAVEINQRLLDLINSFNIDRRRTKAATEGEFVRERLAEAKRSLREAETEFQTFLEANRSYQSSPQLVFEAQRLQRQIDLQQQLFSSLAQAHEEARIEEVRTTPVVTVVSTPDSSVHRSGGGLLRNVLLGLILGASIGVAGALLLEYLERERVRDPVAYASVVGAVRSEFRRMVPAALRRQG